MKNSGGTALASYSYSYSPAGTILTETDTPASSQTPASYTYDAKGRVTSMTPGTGATLSYGFDASSNLTVLPAGAAGSYDKAGELTSSVLSGTTTSYAYNAGGQRLTATQGGTTVSSGTWNGAGQLTAYSGPAGTMTGATYDGAGRRAAATVTPAGGSATTQGFVWDGNSLLMDSANAYIYGPDTAPTEQVNLATGTITYLAGDALGSVRAAVSTSGTITGTANYDAWGNPLSGSNLATVTPFGYAGAYTDPTGLDYLLNRYYDPGTGQFASLDPAVSQTLAPYGYASGNPVDNTDPTGLCPVIGGRVVPCNASGHVNTTHFHYVCYVGCWTPPPPPKPRPRPHPWAGYRYSCNSSAYHLVDHTCRLVGEQLSCNSVAYRFVGGLCKRLPNVKGNLDFSVGVCGSSLLGPAIDLVGTGCIVVAINDKTRHLQVGYTNTSGFGLGVPTVGISFPIMVSNASSLKQLRGSFGNLGGSAELAGGTLGCDGSTGVDASNRQIWVASCGVGAGVRLPGVAIGFEIHGLSTSTKTVTWLNWHY